MGEDKSKDGVDETTQVGSQREHESQRPSTRGGGGGGLLSSIGVASILAGGALASLPWTAPEWSWLGGSASKYGVPPGALVLTGLVLYGLGSVARSTRNAIAAGDEESDEMLILEQLVLDFTKLRDGIQDLRPELAGLKESAAELLRGQQEHAQAQAGESQQDAIFRLAASLDQVGGRIEQRLTSLNTEIGSALTQVTSVITAAQSGGTRSHDHSPGSESHPVSYGRAVDATPMQGDGWVEIDTGASRDLGLLDSFDDQGQLHAPKVSLRVGGPHGENLERHDHVGPLPHANARAARGPTSGSLLGRDAGDGVQRVSPHRAAGESPVGEKLDQLKALLSDTRVRHALELMQGDGRSAS
ncbi:MAG: hypothetical protein ACKVWV_17175 [Planctomycetota bacterium]